MYLPAHFAQTDSAAVAGFLRQYPLATLITHGPNGLDASHVPLLFDAASQTLRGHLARANNQWQGLPSAAEAPNPEQGQPALAIFHGPQHYISPNWYPSKAEHGKVVPTWNYQVVHVHGRLRVLPSPEWLLPVVTALTDQQEATQPHPWRVADAPDDYVQGMLRAIVGVELHIDRLEAKWKLGQNRSAVDQASVVAALRAAGNNQSSPAEQLAAALEVWPKATP